MLRINTVLDASFKEDNFQLPSIMDTINCCKSLVTFFKKSSLYSRLEKTLKQESKTRWNSKLEMLESVYDQFETIYNLLEEKDGLDKLEDIDLRTLQNLTIFLKKFKEATQCLEASKQPTLHLVIPWYKTLLMHCQINSSDHETLKQMKEVVAEKIIEKIKINDLHKLAIFFDPRMKLLKILDHNDANWVKNEIRNQCLDILIQNNNSSDDDGDYNNNLNNEIGERSSKKAKKLNNNVSDFSQYYDSSDEDENNTDEIDQYLLLKIQKDKDLDILQWWKDHQLQYPKLAILSAYYLSIPSSSAPSEREFSAAGLTINQLRTNLDPQTVDSILVLRSAL